jgi:hypothetical protein
VPNMCRNRAVAETDSVFRRLWDEGSKAGYRRQKRGSGEPDQTSRITSPYRTRSLRIPWNAGIFNGTA